MVQRRALGKTGRVPAHDDIPRPHVLVATRLITAANAVVFAAELMLPAPAPDRFIHRFSLVPVVFS
jgi:hypothetical protein